MLKQACDYIVLVLSTVCFNMTYVPEDVNWLTLAGFIAAIVNLAFSE